jgi:hypothetical protein
MPKLAAEVGTTPPGQSSVSGVKKQYEPQPQKAAWQFWKRANLSLARMNK